MPVVPRGWCTRLIETRLFGSGTCARPGLPALSGSKSGRAWYVRDSYKWNASRTRTFLFFCFGLGHSIKSLRRSPISYLMVGVAIGFASTTAFPAVETLSENGKGHVVVRGCDLFAKLGQAARPYRTKASPPFGDRGKKELCY